MSKHIQSFSLRLKVYMRDFFTCVYCKKSMNPLDDSLSLDHVDPKGPDTEDNLVTACKGCNTVKNKNKPVDFLRQVAMRRGVSLGVEMQLPSMNEQIFGRALDLNKPLEHVSKKYRVEIRLLAGRHHSNVKEAVIARAELAIRARRAGHSLPNIGKFLGMHHTSVMHIINRYSERLTLEPTEFPQE